MKKITIVTAIAAILASVSVIAMSEPEGALEDRIKASEMNSACAEGKPSATECLTDRRNS